MNNIKLEDLEKKNIHVVPENYFVQLPQNINKRIPHRTQPKTIAILFPYYKIAAFVFIGLLLSSLLYLNFSSNNSSESAINEMETKNLALREDSNKLIGSPQLNKADIHNQSKSEILIADIDTKEILIYLNNLELEPTPLDDSFEK